MLIDDVQQAMFRAMKARQATETAALRLALSALKSAAIDAGRDLSDEEAVAVLQREARKRREAEQAYRDAGRTERADQEAYERSVLTSSGLSSGMAYTTGGQPGRVAAQSPGPGSRLPSGSYITLVVGRRA